MESRIARLLGDRYEVVEMIGNALRSTKKPKMTSMRKRDLQLWERRLDSIESFARQLKSQGM